MPELPEVETSRRGIEPYMTGQTILQIIVRNGRLRWPVSDRLYQLRDEQIVSVQRRAKYLLLELTAGWIIIHLGMSGSVRILPVGMDEEKHDHIDLLLSNGKMLRYTDPRRFGAWLWCDDLNNTPLLTHLGPEPLGEEFSHDYLFACIRNKRGMIKPWIMDNKVVVGVGNIYASESLFVAGIRPDRIVASLQQEEIGRLVDAIKGVLTHSIQQGGTTLRDFLQSDGKPGYFAQELRVYGRHGKACLQCGETILSVKMAQRNTFYCPSCQR